MNKELNYVILGGSGGIGSSLCRKLTSLGSQVLVVGRDAEKLKSLSDEIPVQTLKADVTNSGEMKSCFGKAGERFGEIHGVVNCVGSLLLKPAHLTTDEDWETTLDLNLTSAFNTVRFATKTMFGSGGSIVLISSAAARVGFINHDAIAAAKAGIIGLTLSAAATYAKNGIRVNAVAPGLIKTAMTERLTANPTMEQASINMHALG
ncbi:MAG: SDR family oxidoreductase, partial [Phycisphaerae bacterium]|nr:SDR family oxidoreductase [Phycisphaerae bacterium]NIW19870.1 SDR family oxidoreductase [candidate division KSB1 bacterium]NIW70369.1 SDR family oxidoreductase [candidate division KSB1 bacterium]